MSEWRETKLGSLGKVITGKTPSKDNPEDWGDAVLFVTPSDYKSYRKKAYSSLRMLSVVGADRQKQRLLPAQSVLVTCIGSDMGKTVVNALPCVTNQQINAIIPNESVIDPDYLYYITKDLYSLLSSLGSDGTAVPILNKSDFENIDIVIPTLAEQKSIASVLTSLDDKIDLLHRQNKTLEAIAETLFRQWFVEGVGEAKPVLLGDYVDVFNGVSYKSDDLKPSKTAMVTLKSFDRNGGFRLDGFKEFIGKYKPEHVVEQGDLVVAHTDITQDAAVIGNPVLVVADPAYEKLVISMDLVKVKSRFDWLTNEFLYVLMRTGDFKQHCLGYSNGSTVLHLSKKAIPSYEFNLPSMEKAQEFSLLAKNLFSKKFKNIEQVRSLEKLRDGLLPKLMSGEVRVE